MSAETLVEALEKAGVGTYSAEYRGMVARDAEAILKVSARFASPEAKREVLAALLRERLEEIADRNGYVYLGTLNSGARRLSKVGRVMELLLAPLEAP